MKTTRREILALAAMGALSAWPASAETASQPAEAPLGHNQADFDQVWELVRDRFYDPRLNGLDWQDERSRFRPRGGVRALARRHGRRHQRDAGQARRLAHALLHAEDPAYYQLADIFQYGLRRRGLDRVFPERRDHLSRASACSPQVDEQGRTFVTGAIEGAPGASRRASAPATKSCRVDGAPFRAGRLFPRQGRQRRSSLSIRRSAGAAPIAINVTPADLQPNEMFLRGLKASARVIAAGNAAIGYVHVWSYASRQLSGSARGPDRRRTAARTPTR